MRPRMRDVGPKLAPLVMATLLLLTTAPAPARAAPEDLRTLYAANGLLERGLYDLALTEYDAFLASDPTPSDATTARYGRAVCLFRLGRTSEAGKALAPLADIRDFAFTQDALYLLAHCQVAEGQPAEAVDSLDRMLAMDQAHPSGPDARVLLIEALHRAAKHQRAMSEADRLLQSDRDEGRRSRANMFRGLAALESGKAADAAASFRAIVDSPDAGDLGTQARLLLAESLVAAAKDTEAERWFEEVIQRNEKDTLPCALYGLGALHFRADDTEASRRLLDRLLDEAEKAPEADAARLLRARIALRDGDLDRASALLARQGRTPP